MYILSTNDGLPITKNHLQNKQGKSPMNVNISVIAKM